MMIETWGDLLAVITVIGCTIWASLDTSVGISKERLSKAKSRAPSASRFAGSRSERPEGCAKRRASDADP